MRFFFCKNCGKLIEEYQVCDNCKVDDTASVDQLTDLGRLFRVVKVSASIIVITSKHTHHAVVNGVCECSQYRRDNKCIHTVLSKRVPCLDLLKKRDT